MAAKEKSDNSKSLVIVESPGKVKTISKFLGSNYVVKASVGHVRDLPEKGIGIDIKNNFKLAVRVLCAPIASRT